MHKARCTCPGPGSFSEAQISLKGELKKRTTETDLVAAIGCFFKSVISLQARLEQIRDDRFLEMEKQKLGGKS